MPDNKHMYNEIKRIGRLLWEKDLATAFNGNISVRLDKDTVLVTGTGTCLGFLEDKDLSCVRLSDGVLVNGSSPTSEKVLHLDIYKKFPDVNGIVHTHSTCTNAFFLTQKVFHPRTFEAIHLLGDVLGVDQDSVNVTNTVPVLECLSGHYLVSLRQHGIVGVGRDLFEAFARVQSLEEQIKMECISRILAGK